MRSAARIVSSGLNVRIGVFFDRTWRPTDAAAAPGGSAERREDVGVAVLAEQRIEVDDRPVHLRVDVDRR